MRVHVLGDDAVFMTSAFDQNAQKQNAGAALTIAGGIAHGSGNHQAVAHLSAAHESIQKGSSITAASQLQRLRRLQGSSITAVSRLRGMGGNSFMRGDDDGGDDDSGDDGSVTVDDTSITDNSDNTDNSVNTTNTTTNNAAGPNFWSFLSSAATAVTPLATGVVAVPAGTSKTSGSILKVSGAPMKISPTMIIIGGAALVAAVVIVAKSRKNSA
jgi:hypothetical protein